MRTNGIVVIKVYTFAMPKYYTPKEANRSLAIVRPMLAEMMRIGEKIRAHQPEIWFVVQKSAGNGGNPELSKLIPDFDRLDALLHQIQDMGIEVKDLTIGLSEALDAAHDERCSTAGDFARYMNEEVSGKWYLRKL